LPVVLAGDYVNLGNVLRDRGELQASLDCYAKAIPMLEQVLVHTPDNATARQFLRNAHVNRSETLKLLEQKTEEKQ
jgi:hypothetical protein